MEYSACNVLPGATQIWESDYKFFVFQAKAPKNEVCPPLAVFHPDLLGRVQGVVRIFSPWLAPRHTCWEDVFAILFSSAAKKIE